jgi:hypothetical protein
MSHIRNQSRQVGALAVLLACFMVAPRASFGAPPAKGEGDEPSELVRQGTEAFLHRNYESARAAFARAYELDPKARTMLQLGLAELNSDHPVEAAAHLREYLTHIDEPADKLEAVRAKWLPRAEARTATLEITAPAGAEVSIDGSLQGQAPLRAIVVREGEHDVSAQLGDLEQTHHVSARGGQLVDVSFELTSPSPPAPPLSTSAANAASTPGPAPEPPPATSSNAKWIAVLATGGGAVVAAGIGIGFAFASQRSGKDAQAARTLIDAKANLTAWSGSECNPPSSPSAGALCNQLDGQTSSQNRQATISNWAYGIAGVLGAASVASFFFWPGSPLRFEPTMGARSAGLSSAGSW